MNELTLLDIIDQLYAANAGSVKYDRTGTCETIEFDAPVFSNRRVLMKLSGDNVCNPKTGVMDFRVRVVLQEV